MTKNISLKFILWHLIFLKLVKPLNLYNADFNYNSKLLQSKSLAKANTTNLLSNQIKQILNMEMKNITLDNFVRNNFDIENVNPVYVFSMSNRKNHTLMLQKSNFQKPIFPNVTNIRNNMKLMLKMTNFNFSNFPKIITTKPNEQKFQNFMLKNELLLDIENQKIIEENVRTERNFIEHMTTNDLKKNKISDVNNKVIKTNRPKNKKNHMSTNKNNNNQVNWNDFGLEGWTGHLREATEEFIDESAEEFSKHKKTLTETPNGRIEFNQEPINNKNNENNNLYNFDNKFRFIPNNINEILQHQFGNLTDSVIKVIREKKKWPITNIRAKHKNDDIFIGRSNNPFGHSTKWKFINSSKLSEHLKQRDGRSKRSVIELYSMIKCGTGCDPLIYKGYGCYCGFLGSGIARDEIDSCCKMHDYCYEIANCPMFLEYFVPYLWKCYRGQPLCAIDNGEWGGRSSCSTRLCKCDQALSLCLSRFYCPRKRPVCQSSPLRILQNYLL